MDNSSVVIGGDIKVKRIGLGTNRITDTSESKRALKKAVEVGINFIDTAASYTGGVSEEVIGKTIGNEAVLIATKGGMHPPDFHVDCRPEQLMKQLDESLLKLGRNRIDLYFLHRVDPKVLFINQINFLKEAQAAGKLRHIGLSDVTLDQLIEARKTINVAAVESEYNATEQKFDNVLNYCEKEGIVFIPYFPLHSYFVERDAIEELKKKHNATESQLALAWLLKKSPIMLPIPGSLSEEHIQENFDALKIDLSFQDFAKMR